MAIEIRPFTWADIPFGTMLTDGEGWHRTTADWVRLVRLEPGGAFKAVVDGMPAGTAAAVTLDRVAWIHSVIVLPDFRHRGVGEALMRACLDFVDRSGIPCTKLDSVEGVESFYARLGFREEYPSWRLLAEGRPTGQKASRLRPADVEDVLEFDRANTGLDRRRALEAILSEFPDRSFLVRRRGKIQGYVIVRRGDRLDAIGPCVADPDDPGTARTLLESALSAAAGRTVRLCVPGYHDRSLGLADDLGFTKESRSTRMVRGSTFRESRACYAMISAEKG